MRDISVSRDPLRVPDFASKIKDFSFEQKQVFYLTLAKYLTVANRYMWSNNTLRDANRLQSMSWINELIHQSINRFENLQNENVIDGDDQALIASLISELDLQSQEARDEVLHALKLSFLWVRECGARYQNHLQKQTQWFN